MMGGAEAEAATAPLEFAPWKISARRTLVSDE